MRAFQVIKWTNEPKEQEKTVSLDCENCGAEALFPTRTGVRIIATQGMGIIFDNIARPANAIPQIVRCPVCRHEFKLAIK